MPAKKVKGSEEPTQQLGARVPRSLYTRLGHYALDHRMRIGDALKEAVEEYLDRHEKKRTGGQ